METQLQILRFVKSVCSKLVYLHLHSFCMFWSVWHRFCTLLTVRIEVSVNIRTTLRGKCFLLCASGIPVLGKETPAVRPAASDVRCAVLCVFHRKALTFLICVFISHLHCTWLEEPTKLVHRYVKVSVTANNPAAAVRRRCRRPSSHHKYNQITTSSTWHLDNQIIYLAVKNSPYFWKQRVYSPQLFVPYPATFESSRIPFPPFLRLI